ncbi:glycophorin-C isoform X2 [Trachypithecus francoisi]|uniref:glycophorin-C isoform X2 n=1 Tax=Trachypithecus francoisi TaxID=54180 RepID=UPI00141B6672|nr:glycophorin-C isoform X2 [Trachypithecus francoisi]
MTSASTTIHITTMDGPDPGVTSASTTMHITTTDGEVLSHSPTTMYTSITAGPYPGVTYALTTTDIAIIAGVIAVVAIVLVCLLFVLLHYMYRHKGTYHTNEAKGTEFAESADAALQGDPALQDAGDNSRKEYFI